MKREDEQSDNFPKSLKSLKSYKVFYKEVFCKKSVTLQGFQGFRDVGIQGRQVTNIRVSVTSFWEGGDNPPCPTGTLLVPLGQPHNEANKTSLRAFIQQDTTIEGIFSLLCVTIVPYNTYNKPPKKSLSGKFLADYMSCYNSFFT